MEFPHLKDTNFPHLDNVDVYSYHNNFDYTRWVVGTKVRLINVLWSSDYNDTVIFENNEARDNWFDNLTDYYEIELTTNAQSVPNGQVKLPIPYDIMARYNYMMISIPQMPGESPFINYEELHGDGVRRWFFFIDSIEYRAPNTTLCNLTLDVWTEYINDYRISYMHVDRTHAAVAATDVEEYLANPLKNNKYLLTPDITPAGADIVRSANYIPFGSGEKWMIIACTVLPTQFEALGTISQNADYVFSDNITFSDLQRRDGYQLQVNGYGIGNGYDYSNLRALCDQTAANGAKIPNGLNTYAVRASEVWGEPEGAHFFQDVIKTCPTFMRTIEACMVVDESMFQLMKPYSYTLAGHEIWWVCGTETVEEMPELTVEDFGFPQRYQRYAKLYTFPYSKMEMTDNEGNTVTVRIENMSNTRYVHKITQLTFPFTNFRMFFSGIDGKGANEYVWKNLVDNDIRKTLPKSDWFEYCFDHEIPCYALYMDGDVDWMLDHFHTFAKAARATDLANYHAAARDANTLKENAEDYDAMVAENTIANANTTEANLKRIAEVTKQNEDDNLQLSAALTLLSQTQASDMTADQISQAGEMVQQANAYSAVNSDIQNSTSVQSAMLNANNALGQGFIGGSLGALGAAGLAAGPIGTGGALAVGAASFLLGSAAGVSNAANINNQATTLVDKNSTLVTNTISQNSAINNINTRHGTSQVAINNVFARDTYEAKRDTANVINPRNKTMADTNATNSGNTSRTNAANLQAVNDANALYTRNAAIEDAQERFIAKAKTSQAYIQDARMKQPVKIGTYSGDPKSDWNQNRGVQLKIKTMSDSEIEEVGDFFVRFGYAINRVWRFSNNKLELCPMNHFCYWKANEIWLDDRTASNNDAQRIIQAIFMKGVTIWKNPDEVGRAYIYGN